ncbi:MAG: PEP-CTERM sorting domain-containing protein [Zoogloea sp.]|nr:PEP-CTERM sorting domain-containing protein [Zoogloea sp.]
MQKRANHPHLIFAALISICGNAVAAPSYSVIDLGTLGGFDSRAYAINSSGQVAGYANTSNGEYHPFVFSAGVMTARIALGGAGGAFSINDSGQIAGESYGSGFTGGRAFLDSAGVTTNLGTLGGSGVSEAFGINSSGQVVGGASYTHPNLDYHAFLYSGGTMTDLGTLGGTTSTARAINDSGQIVGWSTTSTNTTQAFFFNAGVMNDIGTLGGTFSRAVSINASGQAVGSSSINGDTEIHAFFYANDKMTDLGSLGGTQSEARSINASGQVVGWSLTQNDAAQHFFLYSAGTMYDLQDLIDPKAGWLLGNQYHIAINDAGQIAANGCDASGNCHALLLTPIASDIPEPSTLALLGLGGTALLCRRRRH